MGRKNIIIYQCYVTLTEVLALMTPRCRQAAKLAASAVTAAAALSPPPRYRRRRAIAAAMPIAPALLPRCRRRRRNRCHRCQPPPTPPEVNKKNILDVVGK